MGRTPPASDRTGDRESATRGQDEVWDHSELPWNVRVGHGCVLERTRDTFARFRSTRDPGVRLGDDVRVFHGTTFSVEPRGAVEVGDRSVLAGAAFMCVERISLGRGVVCSYQVTIADCDFHPLDPDVRRLDAIANAPQGDRSQRPPLVSAPVVVEDEAWIGIGAIILKGVRIGRGARVCAGGVVTRDVAPGTVVAGNPASSAPADRVG
jgi:acetyltransferase-like isoleucine patch superfamily enzyme